LLNVIRSTGCTHADLFQGENSDHLVSINSARGQVSAANSKILLGVDHSGMGHNQAMIDDTLRLLSADGDIFSPVVFQKPKTKGNHENSPGYLEENFAKTTEALGKVLGFLLGISEASAQEVPTALLTVNSSAPSPGDSITFSATVTGLDVLSVNLTDGADIFLEDPEAPFEWTFDVPSNAAGETTFAVIAVVGETVVESNSVTITILPNFTELQALRFEPESTFILFPGETEQQDIVGDFADGFTRELTQSAMGTVYSERIVNGDIFTPGDSPVIDVDANGLVQGRAPGIAEIVATNNGFTAVRRIHVEPLAVDDSDGDGLTNSQEDGIGTDKYHPDTDNDGSNDATEVGADSLNPRNANNDTVIDALDNQTIVVQDETGGFVSIFTSAGTLSGVLAQPLAELPDRPLELNDIIMEHGTFGFTIENLTPGQAVDVTLDFDSLPDGTNTYLKYGSQIGESNPPQWYEFSNISINGNRIILHLTDITDWVMKTPFLVLSRTLEGPVFLL